MYVYAGRSPEQTPYWDNKVYRIVLYQSTPFFAREIAMGNEMKLSAFKLCVPMVIKEQIN